MPSPMSPPTCCPEDDAGPARAGGAPGPKPRRLILASQSPRRREMLERAGVKFTVVLPTLEDSDLAPGKVDAEAWAASLAYVKALSVIHQLRGSGRPREGVSVLGADTVVVKAGRFIGKARDAAEARAILESLSGGEHEVVTGVALVDAETGERRLMADAARVRMASIAPDRLSAYLAGDGWKGKAGAYNLSERLGDGWCIECDGDPATVMGLPMVKLRPFLDPFCC